MAGDKALWKKGRGKLGVFEPLVGSWRSESDSPMGRAWNRFTLHHDRRLG